ncbi:fimbrial protein [Enterobacter sp. R1(2018)]|uniref:fimbrial protein n=1 Tax=Enterobacter sp. R1(2018) TaxID=2447891 RepID=UPI000EB35B4B|nr:fimbrial protein [Enterobacter sp. R1(2018)]RKQ40812.1 type 1 fimbrial protein [Enterobacter sp. R1(2018)]
MLKIKHIVYLFLTMSALYSGATFAAYTCKHDTGSSPMVVSMPLQELNLYQGNEVGIGYGISNQKFRPSKQMVILCEGTGTLSSGTVYKYSNTPKPEIQISGQARPRYETGMPGVAVSMSPRSNGSLVPVTSGETFYMVAEKVSNGWKITLDPLAYLVNINLTKSGPVGQGIINGRDFPTLTVDYSPGDGNSVRLLTLSFTGTQSISAQTCKTPDVTVVPMGKYDVSKFKNNGSKSDWVSIKIPLTNCPVFYGTNPGYSGEGNYTYYSDNGDRNIGVYKNNMLGVRMTPHTEIIDPANGIMAIKSGSEAASGVGIQIYLYGTENAFNERLIVMPLKQQNFDVNFSARYVRTGENVTPGRADATATITINYY